MMIIEEELVNPQGLPPGVKVFGIPATRLAEELGKKVVLNMVVAGFFTAVTNLVSKDSMRKSIESSVPKGTEGLNLMAFEKGFEYGLTLAKA
jgi:2-oxoglutarate ferredoxin oxidoreductase subunit gamma